MVSWVLTGKLSAMKMIIAVVGFAFLSFVFAVIVIFLQSRKAKRLGTISPVGEKMLRPPGYSLRERADDAFSSFISLSFLGALIPLMLGFFTLLAAVKIHLRDWPTFWIVLSLCVLITIVGWVIGICLASRKFEEFRNVKLGLRGEELVAQSLTPLYQKDYRIFHDFPIEGRREQANIDHIVIGANGVFVVETKMRRKHKKLKTDKESHKVEFTGKELIYPNFRDRHGLGQTEANAKYLEKFIFEKTGHRLPVTGILTLPGWYVTRTGLSPIFVCNHNSVAKAILSRKGAIERKVFRDAVVAVRKQCCDIRI